MLMSKYTTFLDEPEIKKMYDIFQQMQKKGIFKNLSMENFLNGNYQDNTSDINLIADWSNKEKYFPSFNLKSYNAQLLVFYKWMLFNEEIESDRIVLGSDGYLEACDRRNKQQEELFRNFNTTGREREYSPEEAVSLYREVIRIRNWKKFRKTYRIPYSQIVDTKVAKAKVDVSRATTKRALAGGLTGAITLGKGGLVLGTHFGPIGSVLGAGIGGIGGFAIGGIAEFVGECVSIKEYQIRDKELQEIWEYLNLINLLLKVCIGKYYTEEEKKDVCFV